MTLGLATLCLFFFFFDPDLIPNYGNTELKQSTSKADEESSIEMALGKEKIWEVVSLLIIFAPFLFSSHS